MRLLGIDLETTGFDTAEDRITEIGFCVWDEGPMLSESWFIQPDAGMTAKFTEETVAMMKRVCGITPEMLKEFGSPIKDALERLEILVSAHKVEYLVAHNGENYDRPLLLAELDRHGVIAPVLRGLPWIDTRTDLPFENEPESRKLKHLALDAGFINPFPHRALFDVLTMLKVLGGFSLERVLEYQRVPFVTVRALVSYDQRQLAKDARYSWEKLGDKTFPKCWVKKVKENKLEEEKANGKFQVAVIA